MRPALTLAVIALLALALPACQGKVLPTSAQAGSTISIPLAGANGVFVGFGGSEATDYQRGEMVYKLVEPGTNPPVPVLYPSPNPNQGCPEGTQVELSTRLSSLAAPQWSTWLASVPLAYLQVASLVDIPSCAPPGTYALQVVRRMPGGQDFDQWVNPANGSVTSYAYHGTLTILPATVDLLNGSSHTATPTPLQYWNGNVFASVNADNAVPAPEIRVGLSQPVYSVELQLDYPADVIDVETATAAQLAESSYRPMAWLQDTVVGSQGTAILSVASDGTFSFQNVSLSFRLDDGSVAILDPAQVTASVVAAYDVNGVALSGTAISWVSVF